jgi:hypothetical protein
MACRSHDYGFPEQPWSSNMPVQTVPSFVRNHATVQANLADPFNELSKATAILSRNQLSLETDLNQVKKMLEYIIHQLECVPKDPDCVKQQKQIEPPKSEVE